MSIIELTPREFIAQWVGIKEAPIMVNVLAKNMTDFVTVAGKYSKSCFQASFFNQGFYRSGRPWAVRQSKWGKKHNHPLLMESGNLYGAVSGGANNMYDSKNAKKHSGAKIKSKRVAYVIATEEHKKNGRKGKFSRGYAAIHNTDPKLRNFHVNQYSDRKPVQRQFIGFNPNINGYIKRNFVPMLFEGFPR